MLSAAALGLALVGCGGGGGGGGSHAGPTIQVRGTFAPGITLASRDTGLERVLGWLSPQRAYAAGAGTTIDNVVAADASGRFILATKSGNGFTLALPAGRMYLVAFLSGTTTKAIYQADPSGTGWIALPVTSASRDVDLGTLSFDATGVGTGTTPSSSVAAGLGVDAGVASVIALWDVAMQRLANVDVDGDGTFDFQQGRSYWFSIHYEFNPNRTFADIQGVAFADQTVTTYLGYGYDFSAPAGSHAWGGATLTAPAAITPYGAAPSATTPTCFSSPFGGSTESVNFYCGAGSAPGNIATAPMQPPAGDYQVTVDGSTTYTFRNVASQTIDANLYNVYIPAVRLTMAAGKVTGLDVRWWKRTAAGWSQPSAAELSALMVWSGFSFGAAGWVGSTADRVSGDLPVSPSPSASVPAQTTFTPGVLRLSYRDAFGYGYGFEWR